MHSINILITNIPSTDNSATLNVDNYESCDNIKELIFCIYRVPKNSYNLVYNNYVLKDEDRLHQLGIKSGSELKYEPIINTIRVFLNNMPISSGSVKCVLIDADKNATVYQLKEKIKDKYGLPINVYYLTFNGKILNNNDILDSRGIVSESFLRVILRNCF